MYQGLGKSQRGTGVFYHQQDVSEDSYGKAEKAVFGGVCQIEGRIMTFRQKGGIFVV